MDILKLIKVGHSTCVVISKAYLSRLELKKGDYVQVELTTRGLLLRPLKIAKEEVDHGQE